MSTLHFSTVNGLLDVRRKLQPALADVARNHPVKAGFINGHFTPAQTFYPFTVDIHAQHMMTDIRQAGAADETHVTTSNN